MPNNIANNVNFKRPLGFSKVNLNLLGNNQVKPKYNKRIKKAIRKRISHFNGFKITKSRREVNKIPPIILSLIFLS